MLTKAKTTNVTTAMGHKDARARTLTVVSSEGGWSVGAGECALSTDIIRTTSYVLWEMGDRCQ